MLDIKVTLEIICHMVWISSGVGGTYWTHDLLTHIGVKTRYVFL